MSATEPQATLAPDTPGALRAGWGNVLPVTGTLRGGAPGARLAVRVGAQRTPALVQGVPRPGERAGDEWWQALVPVPPVPVARREEVVVELAPRGAAGDGAARIAVGQVLLEPGVPAARTPDPGSRLVAICMATCDPPPELLRAQVESLRAQSHGDWVCLVADDASNATSRAELERLVGGDERFRLLRGERRLGFYRSFERALDAVPPEAAYVALCDQDDRWHPDKLATLIAALGPADVLAHSDARVIDAAGNVLAPTFWPRARPSARLADLLYANAVSGAAALLRAELLEWALPFPELPGRAFHDRWLALVSAAFGGIAYVERPLYDYVQHGQAAHGHARAVGAEPGTGARLRETLTGRRRPDWRAAHEQVLARSVAEAIVLRLRAGERLEPDERRALARVEALPRSAAAQAYVAAHHVRRRLRSGPGIEGALLRGLAWSRLAPARARLDAVRARSRLAGGGDAVPPRSRTRVGIVLTEDRAAAGFGDYHVAHGLGAALEREGVEVAYLEAESRHWPRAARSLTALVVLLDRFPADRLPAGLTAIAWVRNWTERWIERPWFGRYDRVLASSGVSRRLIAERTGAEAVPFPLATDPERFHPRAGAEQAGPDVLFAGNRWGVEREVERVLPELAAAGLEVRVFGRGWEEVPAMRDLCAGVLDEAELAAAYASAALVVDDSAPHARPYGAVNSRVFDALACGTLVASNDAEGVTELFGKEFPVWHDAASLREHARFARDDPARAGRLAAQFRTEVLAAHTYAHRARELCALLGLPAPESTRPRLATTRRVSG